MAVTIVQGKRDRILDEIVERLEAYGKDHPAARIDLYRQDPVSVRVRIIDPSLAELSKAERSRLVWRKYLRGLSEEAQADISTMTLLAPEEASRSIANLDFEDSLAPGK